jgi:hypothetical protein
MDVSNFIKTASFSTADIKANPILGLPAAMRALAKLDDAGKEALREVLLDLQAGCRENEANAIRRRKGPMIAYWMAAGVYCGHIARALRRA